jgi:hypothetical protein
MKTEKYISVVDDNIWPLTAIQISNWSWIFQEYNALCHVSAGPISRNWNMISTHTWLSDCWLVTQIELSPVNSHINFMHSAKGGHSKYIMQLILSHWYFEFHLIHLDIYLGDNKSNICGVKILWFYKSD